MHLPRRAERPFEWNLNTIISLTTLIGVLVGGGYWLNDQDRDIADHTKRLDAIEANSKERRGEIESDFGRIGAQIVGLDDRLDTEEATTTRLSDRVSATEARSAEFAQTLRELQASINQQSGDLKVILSWIEEQRRQSQPAGRRQ